METPRLLSLLQRARWDPGGTPHPSVAGRPRQPGQNTSRTKPYLLVGDSVHRPCSELRNLPQTENSLRAKGGTMKTLQRTWGICFRRCCKKGLGLEPASPIFLLGLNPRLGVLMRSTVGDGKPRKQSPVSLAGASKAL